MTFDVAASMSIPGFISPDELEWLYAEAATMRHVVEVGCWLGRSASALAQGCPGLVYTVDTFQGSPSEIESSHIEALTTNLYAEAQTQLSPWPNVRIMPMSSIQASRKFTIGSVDMVFIDGEHTALSVLSDLLAWYPKCNRLLCGHDSDWDGVREGLARFGVPFEIGPGALWYMRFIDG